MPERKTNAHRDPMPAEPRTSSKAAAPPRVGHVLRAAGRVYRRRFARVAGAGAVVFGLTAVFDLLATDAADRLDVTGIRVALKTAAGFLPLGATLYAGFLDRLVGAHEHGEPDQTISEVLRSLPYGRLIAADILLSLASAVATLFLILPGLIVFTLFSLVGPLINIEDRSVRAAFRRSARLVRPHFWLAFALVTMPLFLEDEVSEVVGAIVHGQPLVVVVVAEAILGATIGAIVGLIVVSLAYELVALHPRAPAQRA